jgi:hypothetical protein
LPIFNDDKSKNKAEKAAERLSKSRLRAILARLDNVLQQWIIASYTKNLSQICG